MKAEHSRLIARKVAQNLVLLTDNKVKLACYVDILTSAISLFSCSLNNMSVNFGYRIV